MPGISGACKILFRFFCLNFLVGDVGDREYGESARLEPIDMTGFRHSRLCHN